MIKRIMKYTGGAKISKGLRIGVAAMALFPLLSQAFQSPFELSSLYGTGKNGFIINGITSNNFSAWSVSRAGDINSDGFDDLIIGAPNGSPDGKTHAGQSYVMYGRGIGQTIPFDLSDLLINGNTRGFVINGITAGNSSGYSVSGAGDINNDGFDDLIIGAPFASPNGKSNAGQSYVVYGTNGGIASPLNLSDLLINGNTRGFAINGITAGDSSGCSVSGAGDINNDGFDDLIIGASGADPNGKSGAGQSYVLFGKSTGFVSPLNLSNLLVNGNAYGFVMNGITAGDDLGFVSGVGDINNDGFDDLIIGAQGASPSGKTDAGQSYVIYGTNGGFVSPFDLSDLLINSNTRGFVMNGITAGDLSGRSVSGAGDINNDGFDDLLIGAPFASPNGKNSAGQSYVVYGTNGGIASPLNLSDLLINGNTRGFVINGIMANDWFGSSVNGPGDINGDGFDDLIMGAWQADPNGKIDAGQSYVVFGKSAGFTSPLELSSLNGVNGFAMNGITAGDHAAWSVSGAGDFNGDGYNDLIVGAVSADPHGGDSGQSYVIYGEGKVLGDADGDNQSDIILGTDYIGITPIPNKVMAALMTNGIYTGKKITLLTFTDPYEKVVAVNDFDLDGKMDLATQSTTNLFLRKGPAYNIVTSINLMPNPWFNINPQIVASGNVMGNQFKNKIGYPDLIIKSGKYINGTIRECWRAYVNFGNWGFGLSSLFYISTNNYNLVGCGRFMFDLTKPMNPFSDVLMENSSSWSKTTYARKATNILVNGPVVGSTNSFSAPVLGAANFKPANLVYELVSTNGNKVYIGGNIYGASFSGYSLLPGEKIVGPK